LIIMPDELDADIWKLNCKNGVVDLKTGELLPHKREYYMSKICPVEYKPSSKAPRWMDFLNTITGRKQRACKIPSKSCRLVIKRRYFRAGPIRPLWNRSKRKKAHF